MSLPQKRERGSATRVLLIDLDNLGVRTKEFGRAIHGLTAAAGKCDRAIAVGLAVNVERAQSACDAAGVTIVTAQPGRNSADRILLDHAVAWHAAGAREFYISSSDGIFSQLPGTVHVVLARNLPLSEQLRRRASSVQCLQIGAPAPRMSGVIGARAAASRPDGDPQVDGETSSPLGVPEPRNGASSVAAI